jgi:hypothetical protein
MTAKFIPVVTKLSSRKVIESEKRKVEGRDGYTYTLNGVKHEEITVSIKLVSSGNTRLLTDSEIIHMIQNKLI